MILSMSDVFWQAAIAGVVTLVLAWMQRRTIQKLDKNTDVTEQVQQKLDRNTQVTETVHKLVNSAFLHQLRLHAHTARILSDVTNEDAHRQIAEEAERVLKEHLRMGEKA